MFPSLLCNQLPYPLDVLSRLVGIPESYHTNVQIPEIPMTMSVMLLASYICMLSSINFNG
jgi:hypothetical protein